MVQKEKMNVPISENNIKIGKEYDNVALSGLLNFLEALYEDLLYDINKEGLAPLEAIKSELEEVKRLRKIWLN